MPRGQYNEVIIDTASVETHLPRVVEAFFYMKTGSPGSAARVREDFMKEFSSVHGTNFPLVMIDPKNRNEPFSDGETAGGLITSQGEGIYSTVG